MSMPMLVVDTQADIDAEWGRQVRRWWLLFGEAITQMGRDLVQAFQGLGESMLKMHAGFEHVHWSMVQAKLVPNPFEVRLPGQCWTSPVSGEKFVVRGRRPLQRHWVPVERRWRRK